MTDPKVAAPLRFGGRAMGFPMTVERVISRNYIDPASTLADDVRRLAADSVTLERAGLREALEGLLRATEFPAFDMDGIPGSVRVSRTHLHPLIEAAEQARAALAAAPQSSLDVERLARAMWKVDTEHEHRGLMTVEQEAAAIAAAYAAGGEQ